ncbi:MAG: hypothetical protein MZV65_44685 [Chromatiales bacterium]|nr:hypothetical protein [Chromatiales bacterium]
MIADAYEARDFAQRACARSWRLADHRQRSTSTTGTSPGSWPSRQGREAELLAVCSNAHGLVPAADAAV